MINETILLLTYYYKPEDASHRLLRHIIKGGYCPAYLPWDIYLTEPLRKVFSKVIVYDFLKRRAEIGIEAMNREIIDLVSIERAKYVLWTSFYYDIQPATLQRLRRNGVKVVGWFLDDEWRFDSYSRFWASHLDYCVTNAVSAVPKYEALGSRVIQTIPNTGTAFERNWTELDGKYGVSFVGNADFADRKTYMARLSKSGVLVEQFGGRSERYLSFDEMINVFQMSKINLNFSKAGAYYWERQIKGRVFQVCLAGGFLLTEYAPGLENYFEIDKEIACFETAEELVKKVKYYLSHDAERLSIAKAGWEKAGSEHTSSNMVARVFEQIEQNTSLADSSPHQEQLKMPLLKRTILPAQYHFHWGKALLEENYEKPLYREALTQSLSWSPLNIGAWYYSMVGVLPASLRHPSTSMYNLASRFPGIVFRWLRGTHLRKPMQRLLKKLI